MSRKKKKDTPTPPKRPSELILPIKLSPEQRKPFLDNQAVRPGVKRRLRDAGDGVQTIGVTRKEFEQLYAVAVELGQRPGDKDDPDVVDALFELRDMAGLIEELDCGQAYALSRIEAAWKRQRVFEFVVMLRGEFPTIWRRIQVKDCTLETLDLHFAAAIGWARPTQHRFEIDGRTYVTHDPEDEIGYDLQFYENFRDESRTTLLELFRESPVPAEWRYYRGRYSMSLHEVRFVGSPAIDRRATYPRCLGGEGASPMKECSDAEEHAAYVYARRNHRSFKYRYYYTPFNPEKFNLSSVNARLRSPQTPVSRHVDLNAVYAPQRWYP